MNFLPLITESGKIIKKKNFWILDNPSTLKKIDCVPNDTHIKMGRYDIHVVFEKDGNKFDVPHFMKVTDLNTGKIVVVNKWKGYIEDFYLSIKRCDR